MGSLAVSRLADDDDLSSASIAEQVAIIACKSLAPQAAAIDAGTVYPEELLRHLGKVGAWGSHQVKNGAADLRCAIQSMAALGEVCGATAFMAWCQNTLVWYAANSDNPKLSAKFTDKFASGQVLGGTGLSNPMKSFFGIEKLKLKGVSGNRKSFFLEVEFIQIKGFYDNSVEKIIKFAWIILFHHFQNFFQLLRIEAFYLRDQGRI